MNKFKNILLSTKDKIFNVYEYLKPESLEKSILIRVAFLFIFTTFIMGTLSIILMYSYHVRVVEKQIVKENQLKAEKEGLRFQNAVVQLNLLKNEIIDSLIKNEYKKEFSKYMELNEDGSFRTYKSLSKNGKKAVGFINNQANISNDIEFQEQFMTVYDLIQSVGYINKENYFMTWAVFPNNSNIVFCPQKPNANYEISGDFADTKEEYWKSSLLENNKSKTGKWLNPYFDPSFNVWMVSYIVPIYFKDKHLLTIGFDITIDDFFKRVLKSENDKMFNFVLSKDGALIAHPDYMDKIQSDDFKKGFSIFNTEEKEILSKLLVSTYLETENLKYTVSSIENTDWLLVSAYQNMNASYIKSHIAIVCLFVVVFLVLLLIGSNLFLKERLTKPLVDLNENMKDNYRLKKYKKIKMTTMSEINDVINSYNKLLEAYEEKDYQLSLFNRNLSEELDKALKNTLKLAKSTVMHDVMRNVNADVYNPLILLKNTIDYLKTGFNKQNFENYPKYFEQSEKIISRMSTLVVRLDVISKSLIPEVAMPINIDSLMSKLHEIYDNSLKDKKIAITWDYNGSKNYEIKEYSVLYALIILIDNAIESISNTKPENPLIKVELVEKDGKLIFKVTNSGQKVPPDIVEKILSPNSSGGFSTKRGHKGFGLHTCLALVKDCEGSIQYVEENNQPCFELTYPLRKIEYFKKSS